MSTAQDLKAFSDIEPPALRSFINTLVFSTVTGFLSLILYGCCVRYGYARAISPRCATRPMEVLYQPSLSAPLPFSTFMRCLNSCSPLAFKWMEKVLRFEGWSWVPWIMRLTYEDLLTGIPGTGTHEKGKSGKLLTINLDAVVFLEFIDVCYKICWSKVFISLIVVLPLCYTSKCFSEDEDDNISTDWRDRCIFTDSGGKDQKFTDYVHLTIANIPRQGTADAVHFDSQMRYFFIALAIAFTTYHALCILNETWVQIVSMRMSYYLNRDHYGDYMTDIARMPRNKTLDFSDNAEWDNDIEGNGCNRENEPGDKRRRAIFFRSSENKHSVDETFERDAFWKIPNYVDETISSIELYSVLITNIPQDEEFQDSNDANNHAIHQVKNLFEKCFQPQPGYSSAIAALTILPPPAAVSRAWMKWEKVQKLLRKLAYLRALIADRTEEASHLQYKDYLGNENDSEIERIMVHERFYEFDQLGAYHRESARIAGCACKPYGNTSILDDLDVEDLIDTERKLTEQIIDECKSLIRRQASAIQSLSQKSLDERDKGVTLVEAQDSIVDSQDCENGTTCSDSDSEDVELRKLSKLYLDEESVRLSERKRGYVEVSKRFLIKGAPMIRKISRGLSRGVGTRELELLYDTTPLRHYNEVNVLNAFSPDSVDKPIAVVTFVDRLSASIARNMQLDGSPDGWKTFPRLPHHPLADGAVGVKGLQNKRDCCRPVTLTLREEKKRLRVAITSYINAFIFLCYTYPISYSNEIINNEDFKKFVIDTFGVDDEGFERLRGLVSASVLMITFVLLPLIFKMLSNIGSAAANLFERDKWCLDVYWKFTLLVTFTGSSLVNVADKILLFQWDNLKINDFTKIAVDITNLLPISLASIYTNLVLVRTLVILPLMELLNLPLLSFSIIRWSCCTRCMTGGGFGAPVAYRTYIDAGLVLLTSVLLSSSSPLVSLACLAYFACLRPILRRQLLFVRRPEYNSGGSLWPFLADVVISSLIVMQLFSSLMLLLRGSPAGFFVCLVQVPLTLISRSTMSKKYMNSFLRNSLRDTCSADRHEAKRERMARLRFLVDAHKAAYLPICLSLVEDDEHLIKKLSVFPAKAL